MSKGLNRRSALRGMLGGAAVTVGVPFLDCFLNTNGTALANGSTLPICFGTWLYGLGLDPGLWEPKTTGANYEFGPQLKALDPHKDVINVYSGLKVGLDANPNTPHATGWQGISSGNAKYSQPDPSIDSIVADAIGSTTRFRSLEVACDGTKTSLSRRGSSPNPSEMSPVALYTRIFGPEFKDPNAADFTPDPNTMLRRSALSAITEQRQGLAAKLGAADRARLDEYFTSLRELEQQLDLALQKPAPLEACTVPGKVTEAVPGVIVEDALANQKLFAALLGHALACGQTRVVNVLFSEALSNLRRAGSSMSYHMYTHEEAADPQLGYQVNSAWFRARCIDGFADFVTAMKAIKEGPGTLLDRMLVMTVTDTGAARTHGVENIPMLTAGRAGGRLKTGIHIAAKGDPVTRVGLTVQQAVGVRTSSWGSESNATSRAFTEVLA